PGPLRLPHRPGQRGHLPAHRPVRPAEAGPAGRLEAAAGQPGGNLPGLPADPSDGRPLPAGREGRGLGIHLPASRTPHPSPEPERPAQRPSRLRAVLDPPGRRLDRLVPLLPVLRRHLPPRVIASGRTIRSSAWPISILKSRVSRESTTTVSAGR